MSTIRLCEHNTLKSICDKCCNNMYCRCCSNANTNHTESNCPYKLHAAISSANRARACRALGCMDCAPGQTHYCDICRDNDANHRSISCPLKYNNNNNNNSSNNNTRIAYCQPAVVIQQRPPAVVIQQRSPNVIIHQSQPAVVIQQSQPIFVGNPVAKPIVGFATSNGVFYFG